MAEQGKGSEFNVVKQTNKRPADAISGGLSQRSPIKIQKTSDSKKLAPYPGIDENVSLSQLTVGQLNALMWYNFQQMQSQTLFAALSNMENMVTKKVTEQISRIETVVEQKIKSVSDDLNKRMKTVEVRQLESDIDMASIRQSIDEMKSQVEDDGETKPVKPETVIIKNLDVSEDEFTSDIGLQTDVMTFIRDVLKLENIHISSVKRLRPIVTKNGSKPGHVCVTVANKDQQTAILKSKSRLKTNTKYKDVWIQPDRPKEVRAMENNCRLLLKEMGKEKKYRFRGSTLVKKDNNASANKLPQQSPSHQTPAAELSADRTQTTSPAAPSSPR